MGLPLSTLNIPFRFLKGHHPKVCWNKNVGESCSDFCWDSYPLPDGPGCYTSCLMAGKVVLPSTIVENFLRDRGRLETPDQSSCFYLNRQVP